LYEYQKQLLLRRMLLRGSTVYDIGAHAGFHTLLASRIVGPSGHVCAFEPLPRNLRYLYEHLRLNRATNVQVIEAAVAEHAGNETFVEHGTYMGKLRPGGSLSVKTVALDPLIEGGRIPPPDFVKMDVEGAEVRALRGMRDTLATHRPTLFLSTHAPALHRESLELLRLLGYSVRPLTGRSVLQTDELVAMHPVLAKSIAR
jgi:FkbM family methyltransferase